MHVFVLVCDPRNVSWTGNLVWSQIKKIGKWNLRDSQIRYVLSASKLKSWSVLVCMPWVRKQWPMDAWVLNKVASSEKILYCIIRLSLSFAWFQFCRAANVIIAFACDLSNPKLLVQAEYMVIISWSKAPLKLWLSHKHSNCPNCWSWRRHDSFQCLSFSSRIGRQDGDFLKLENMDFIPIYNDERTNCLSFFLTVIQGMNPEPANLYKVKGKKLTT